MSIPFLRPLLLASLLAFAGAAQAATMTAPVDGAGNFTVTDTTGPMAPEVFDFNVNPTTSPFPVIFYDMNVPDQSVGNIRTNIAAAYSVSASSLNVASTCDSISGGCAGLTTSPTTFSLAGVAPFDYLAIHFGGGELFFHWASPITAMTLTALDGFPGGLSNYRSYSTVPLPGAFALFLGALAFLARRKVARPAMGEPTPA